MYEWNSWAYYPIALHAALTSYVAWLSGLRSDVLLLSKPPDLFSVPRCGFQPTLPITTTSRFSTSMAPGWQLSVRTCRNDIFSCNIYPTISLPSYTHGFCYPARALRALGLLLYSRIPQWEGGRLFDRSAGFFYGNSCNSGTESRKIVPKVGN